MNASSCSPGASALKTRGVNTAFRQKVAEIRNASQLLMATLREIFDESAYARFLSRQQVSSSRAAYAAFWREHEAVKARRPRCC